MKTEIIEQDENSITIKIDIRNNNNTFLKTEEDIAREVNSIGNVLTKKSLEALDEDKPTIKKDGIDLHFDGTQKKK